MDFVIDGVGGLYIGQGFCALKAGGKLAEYAYPNFKGMLAGLLKLKLLHLFSNGKYGEFYGISTGYKKDKTNIQEDMESLFHLLKDGKINPIISERSIQLFRKDFQFLKRQKRIQCLSLVRYQEKSCWLRQIMVVFPC